MWRFDSDRIRLAREARGFSQSELAAKAGVATHRVDAWEKGKVKPNQDSLVAICNITDLHPRFFFVNDILRCVIE